MSDLYWLTDEQMARLQPYFPKSHGRKRVDDRRVLSGIIFVNRNGLRWRDAPREYGPAKTLYNRWKRWSDKGIFIRMMEILTVPDDPNGQNDRTDLDQENQFRTLSKSSSPMRFGPDPRITIPASGP